MKKIIRRFGIDKVYHFVAGFVIALIFGLFNPIVGLLLAGGAGVGKELYDVYIKKSFADPIDTIATVLGGVLGVVIAILLTNIT